MSDTGLRRPGGGLRDPAATPRQAFPLSGDPTKKTGRAVHLPKSDVPSVPETLKRPGGEKPT